jgi:flotillin
LDLLIKTLVSTVPTVEVQNVTLVDTKGGNFGTQLAAFSEQMRQTTGLDLPGAVNRLGKPSSDPQNPFGRSTRPVIPSPQSIEKSPSQDSEGAS